MCAYTHTHTHTHTHAHTLHNNKQSNAYRVYWYHRQCIRHQFCFQHQQILLTQHHLPQYIHHWWVGRSSEIELHTKYHNHEIVYTIMLATLWLANLIVGHSSEITNLVSRFVWFLPRFLSCILCDFWLQLSCYQGHSVFRWEDRRCL